MNETSPSLGQPKTELGAYFYPDADCYSRTKRSMALRQQLDLADHPLVTNDLALLDSMPNLLPGSRRPHYGFKREGPPVDNVDTANLYVQAHLARAAGLSYWVVDTYEGTQTMNDSTCRVVELGTSLEKIRQLGESSLWQDMIGLRYAKLEVLEGPRSILPIPSSTQLTREDGIGFFVEPGREYDINEATAQVIVKSSITHWKNPMYMRIDGNPYLSFLMPQLTAQKNRTDVQQQLADFVGSLREQARKEFGSELYIVGVMRQVDDVALLASTGVNAVTQYIALPYFGPGQPALQDYKELLPRRTAEWARLQEDAARHGIPFIPAPAMGWDASPRGSALAPNTTLADVAGIHPYTPIVTNNTPELFGKMVGNAIEFTQQQVPPEAQKITIFAWNEYGEGASLLRLAGLPAEEGSIEPHHPYLDMLSIVTHEAGLCYTALCQCCRITRELRSAL